MTGNQESAWRQLPPRQTSRSQEAALFPLQATPPHPHIEPQSIEMGSPPWRSRLRLCPTQFSGPLFYFRPCYQDRVSQQHCLIHRNKYREAAKLRRQRNMAQLKEQNKTPEKELNEMEISNLSEAEFIHWLLRYSRNSLDNSTA